MYSTASILHNHKKEVDYFLAHQIHLVDLIRIGLIEAFFKSAFFKIRQMPESPKKYLLLIS